MDSLYVMFIPKSKRINFNPAFSSRKFPMPSIIRRLLDSSKWENHLLVSPGYLSQNKNTTNYFYENFDVLTDYKNNVERQKPMLGFLRGMSSESHYSNLVKYQMDELLNNNHCFQQGLLLDISGTLADHRKMVFLYSISDESNSFAHRAKSRITSSNKKEFLNSITVNAVCIGSTNFNNTSYFRATNPSQSIIANAGYGEADVVLMATSLKSVSSNFYDLVGAFAEQDLPANNGEFEQKGDGLYSSIREEFFYATFAKATYEGGFKDPHDYLKNMLELTIDDQLP